MSQRGSAAIHHVYGVRLLHRGNEHTHTNTPAIYVVYNVAAGVHVQYNICIYVYIVYICIVLSICKEKFTECHILVFPPILRRFLTTILLYYLAGCSMCARCCTKPPKLIGVYGYITCICLARNVYKLYAFTKCEWLLDIMIVHI